MRETLRDFVIAIGAAAARVAAVGVLWNGIQIAELSGKVDALSEMLTAHVNAPGLHGD